MLKDINDHFFGKKEEPKKFSRGRSKISTKLMFKKSVSKLGSMSKRRRDKLGT